MIRVLFLGEIIGIPTTKVLKKRLPEVKEKYGIDFTIANCDGASDGFGVLMNTLYHLHLFGIDIITTGEHIYNKKDTREGLSKFGYSLRAYNLPKDRENTGKGYTIVNVKNKNIAIINLLGRTNIQKIFVLDPFYAIEKFLQKTNKNIDMIIVDFHGGTTSEIQSMHWYLVDRVNLVVGTHLRILTTDNRIIGNKTGVITGNGFCGVKNSCFGLSIDIETKKIKTGQFSYSKVPEGDIGIQGIIVDLDEETNKTLSVELLQE